MIYIILFIFGIAIGSFLNVVALRYDGEHFTFDPKVIGGRSHCPHCKTTLQWYELVPLFSFLVQGGKCRHCKARLGFGYPLVEFISGAIFVAVPWRIGSGGAGSTGLLEVVLTVVVFEILLLISYIDLRLGVIPDELNIAVAVLGIFAALFAAPAAGAGVGSVLLLNRAEGAAFGFAFFMALVLVTRGRGMGMGDVLLALALGLFFGWPGIVFISAVAFMLGAIVGVGFILARKKTMKSSLPFGPFLAVGTLLIFLVGLPALLAALGLG